MWATAGEQLAHGRVQPGLDIAPSTLVLRLLLDPDDLCCTVVYKNLRKNTAQNVQCSFACSKPFSGPLLYHTPAGYANTGIFKTTC